MEDLSVGDVAKKARDASFAMKSLSIKERNAGLLGLTNALQAAKKAIFQANSEDLRRSQEERCPASLLARLDVTGAKFDSFLQGIQVVIDQPDMLGTVSLAKELTQGLNLYRVSCPIGVICVIYEARPEAAVQIASLCVKSGNCVILKGGKEASLTNRAIAEAMRAGLVKTQVPRDCVQLVSTRGEVSSLLKMNNLIDLVIPRGSNQLVSNVIANTSIPVLGHADGICSIFLDEDCPDFAPNIVEDSKCNYPSACNAAENLLVHSKLLGSSVFQQVVDKLASNQVSFIADTKSYSYLPQSSSELAPEGFLFDVEHLALRISVKTVDSLQEAVNHINQFGSHHTDVILTKSEANAHHFTNSVDSASVYHNCSSRFADGFRYGFGAEVGVSTNRVHARGPVGVEGLLTYKYVALGHGNTVGGMKNDEFTHKDLDNSDELVARDRVKRMKQ